MFNILKKMIQSGRYTKKFIEERVNAFYLTEKLTKKEYMELNDLLKELE